MISNIHLSTILFFAAIIWGILLIINGVAVSLTWLHPLSTVTGILILLLTAFDLWLWRLPFLQGWFVARPSIYGTWRATVQSSWVDPSIGNTTETIEGYMTIRQTFSSLSMRLMTNESGSELIGAKIIRAPDGVFRVTGVYRNEPKLSVQDRSHIHHGAILLQVVGAPPVALKGHYWTDRDSKGEIELTNREKKIFHDFETARREFNVERSGNTTEVGNSV